MPNYKLLNSAGDWRKGDVVSDKDINDSNLGGVERLLSLKAIEQTDEPAKLHRPEGEARSANETKGDNVEPEDTVDKRAERRAEAVGKVNDGKRTADDDSGETDAAVRANPRTGSPGTVVRTTGGRGRQAAE